MGINGPVKVSEKKFNLQLDLGKKNFQSPLLKRLWTLKV